LKKKAVGQKRRNGALDAKLLGKRRQTCRKGNATIGGKRDKKKKRKNPYFREGSR